MKTILKAVLIFSLSTTIGCASLAKYDQGYRYPFGATTVDLVMIYFSITGKPAGESPDPWDFIYTPLIIPLLIMDIPFSLVTDVVTLPYDIWHIKDIGKEPRRDRQ